MAWQNPKTNWTAADGVRNTDFNRIEGDLLELYNVESLKASKTVYVATSGNDTTGTGASNAPYRTIVKAISSLPRNLGNHTATISIAAGNYDENVTIAGFNGVLNIILTGDVRITTLVVDGCHVRQTGRQLTISPGANSTGLKMQNGATLYCGGTSWYIIAGSIGIDLSEGSALSIFGVVTINNTTSSGIDCYGGSRCYLSSITGSNNATAMLATASGCIAYGSTSIQATTRHITNNGGRIYTGAQTNVPSY